MYLHVPAFAGVVLIKVVTALPYAAFMFRSALASHEYRYEDVVRSLGASTYQAVRHVRVPLLATATALAFFLAFLVRWGDYVATLIAGGGRLTTLPMLLWSAASATGNEQLTAVLPLAIIVPPVFLLGVLGIPAVTRKALT